MEKHNKITVDSGNFKSWNQEQRMWSLSTKGELAMQTVNNKNKNRLSAQRTPVLFRIFLVGVLIVTNSSAAVGWIPTVASKSSLVKPAFTATAKPWNFERFYYHKCKFRICSIQKGKKTAIESKALTCTISGESSPHICNPRTLFVFAQTTSFMKTRSGSPDRVAFKGRKFAVKMSTSPYRSTACQKTCEF